MRIALDSWVLASRFRNQGIHVYAQHLFREFRRVAAKEGLQFTLFAGSNGNDAAGISAADSFDVRRSRLLDHAQFWRLAGAAIAAAAEHADLLFAPSASVLPSGAVPLVSTIHDVTPVVMPSHSPKVNSVQKGFLWAAAKGSRAVITDSECSKNDIVKLYGVPEDRVSVVYLGYDRAIFNDEPAQQQALGGLLPRLGVGPHYILHHGTVQPRKNLERLVQAYRLVMSRRPSFDFDLVLAGALGWHYEGIVAAAKAEGPGRVILTGPLPDPELALLIKGASLAVIPSLYEGFCLPMVECMACGTPTIVANASCLPEVSGGVLRYFDPLSVEEMAVRIQEALEDTAARQQLAARGKERASQFDWVRCAAETLRILKREATA